MRFRNAVLLCSLAATLALASCSTAPISPIGEKVATNQIFSSGYGPVEDHGYGLVTFFKVPGGFEIQLYQPKYAK